MQAVCLGCWWLLVGNNYLVAVSPACISHRALLCRCRPVRCSLWRWWS